MQAYPRPKTITITLLQVPLTSGTPVLLLTPDGPICTARSYTSVVNFTGLVIVETTLFTSIVKGTFHNTKLHMFTFQNTSNCIITVHMHQSRISIHTFIIWKHAITWVWPRIHIAYMNLLGNNQKMHII